MSESEVERLARLETRMDRCDELAAAVIELRSALDMMRGAGKLAYVIMAACGAIGGIIAKLVPWGAR